MSSLPTSPSQLAPLTSNPHFRAIIEASAKRYADHFYLSSLEEIEVTSGDGMARHSEFNRGMADGFKRRAKRGGWTWKSKHDPTLPFIGDLVYLLKHNGQMRFGVQIGDLKFSLLHMTGKVDIYQRKIEVMKIGPSRGDYIHGQSSAVVRVEPPNIFNSVGEPEDFRLRVQTEEAMHIIIVTQRCGDLVRVYAGSPVNYWEEEGIIPMAELEHLFDVPIKKTGETPMVKPKRSPETDLDITVFKR